MLYAILSQLATDLIGSWFGGLNAAFQIGDDGAHADPDGIR